jgi:hypothetical protein
MFMNVSRLAQAERDGHEAEEDNDATSTHDHNCLLTHHTLQLRQRPKPDPILFYL